MGLFLVFWGHIRYGGSPAASVIHRAIYSFHMPMYFILSGYVIKSDLSPFSEYFKKKFFRILLPSILIYISTLPIFYLIFSDYSSVVSLKVLICDICYVRGLCAYNAPVWFFFCYFEVLLVAKGLRLVESSNKKMIIILILSLLLSFACYVSGWKIFNLFGFNKFLLGLFFLTFGMLLKRVKYDHFMGLIGIFSLPIWFFAGVLFNPKVSMYMMNLGNFWFFIISGITGSLAFFSLSKLFENNNKIRQYSKYTVFIICSHFIFASLINVVLLQKYNLSIAGTYYFDLVSVLFVFIIMCLYKPVCDYLNEHFPLLIGNYHAKNIERNQ